LGAAVDEAVVATRQLAKRQFTWLRARPLIKWVDSVQPDALLALKHELSEIGIAEWSSV
jgi:tRNA A37 N6-isopentenylltransferase MiaA